ncbi:phenylalanine 4-monooxygenase [Paraferrimonas sedimenticola]|uniref:Phenylalanine-4-hydroxylase n=1 Tax=Paraferrimonas sedimenticola TaxID=375674 RepID=A0AA37RTK6_9GAMM|nr:phenylalanine 4-monooxygenase [Paraferrimonas sedimenticola]GLP94832.1 phenylalanine 4-monooxygenase [Paraferrimonas sedimenticola]
MSKASQYQARQPDENGHIEYSDAEHLVWHKLYARQIDNLPGKACTQYLDGLQQLNMTADRIPQLAEIDAVLKVTTGWRTEPVPALISFERFFDLLANKAFPVATFIRTEQDFDYLQEPDIFHEIFGHCPLLTNPAFAYFTETYGKLGVNASPQERVYLARLYWFTVEFGLLKAPDHGLSIYGGGILSSPGETNYALSDQPQVKDFDLVDVLRTPYRIDIMQPLYFSLENFEQLFEIANMDIMAAVREAMRLGLHQPLFDTNQDKAS